MSTDTQPLEVLQCPLEGRRLIEASAGTGKTYTICLLYLRAIIERNVAVRDLLVVSFTKAATAELKERIRARLVETLSHLRADDPPPVDQGLSDLLAHYRTQGRDVVMMQKQLAAAIAAFDEAAVHTIHGFCKRVIDDAPFVTGMPLEVELMEDDAEFRSQVTADLYREWLATHAPSPATVASLWQGQTLRDLEIEVKRRLAKPLATLQWPPLRPLPEASECEARETRYTAARQCWLDERVEIIAALNASLPALHAGIYKTSTIATAAQQWDSLLQSPTFALAQQPKGKDSKLQLFSRHSINDKISKGKKSKNAEVIWHPFFTQAEALIADLTAREADADQARSNLVQFVVQEAGARMAALKRSARVLTYDDLLKALYERLSDAAGAALASDLGRRFPLALVDEFQDTDPLQYGIFDRIYAGGGTLLLVGDPKQAIYAFRNADLNVYLQARETAVERYTLTHNQRSSGAYLQALNALFGLNPQAFILDGLVYHGLREGAKKKKAFHDADASRGALHLWTLPGGGEGDILGTQAARSAVATATAAEISRLLRGARDGEVMYDGRPLAAGDIAVIVPTHARGSEIRSALARLGIGAVELSRDSVFATDEARDLACLLDAVLSPNRAGLIRAALTTSLLGYTATALRALNADDDRLIAEFERFERYRALWVERGIGALLRSMAVDFGVTERLLITGSGERRLTNLRQLTEILQTASAEHPAPDALRHWLQSEIDEESADEISQLRLESDRDLVQIVSIHASKGLEYPIVFCPTLWDEFLNGGKKRRGLAKEYHDDTNALVIDYRELASDDPMKARIDREVDAERIRLLYVALTRAIHRAYLVVGPWKSGRSLKAAGRMGLQWLMAEGIDYDTFKSRECDPAAVTAEWSRLTEACEHVTCERLPTAVGLALPPPPVEPERLVARVLNADVPRARRFGSFSSLVHGASHEVAVKDRDARAQEAEADREPVPVPDDDIRRFARGARAGECIHAVFEDVDFTHAAGWPQAIAQALTQHPPGGRETDLQLQSAMLQSMLTQVLATPLGDGLMLNTIGLKDRLVEWEFSLPAGRLDAATLSRLLADYGYRVPPLRFSALEGYLRGFVDLIVRHQGRFYVIDWKSNVLGEQAVDYDDQAVEAAMIANGYHVQHLLYTVALHRWLQRRMPGYQYETHMGGTRYLFIRAVRPDWPGAGVYANRPPLALVESLCALLDGAGKSV